MNNDPTVSYQLASARGASPVGQVVALYDTVLRDLVRALAALQDGNIETRVFELNHALLVIAHLQNVLNHERGGEAAKHFEQFYSVTRGMIVDANIRATPEALEELIDLYGGLRQAWYEVEKELRVQNPNAEARVPENDRPAGGAGTHNGTDAGEDAKMAQLQWSA